METSNMSLRSRTVQHLTEKVQIIGRILHLCLTSKEHKTYGFAWLEIQPLCHTLFPPPLFLSHLDLSSTFPLLFPAFCPHLLLSGIIKPSSLNSSLFTHSNGCVAVSAEERSRRWNKSEYGC